MSALGTTSVFYISTRSFSWWEMVCIFILSSTIIAIQFIWNDLCDFEIDLVKGKQHFLGLDQRAPYAVILSLFCLTMLSILGLNIWFVIIWIIINFTLTWYSRAINQYNAFLGNHICAAVVMLGILSPSLAYGAPSIFYTMFAPAYFLILGREILMDHADYYADRQFRKNTLTDLVGEQQAKYIGYFAIHTFAISSIVSAYVFLPEALGIFSAMSLVFLAMLHFFYNHPHKIITFVKFFWLVALGVYGSCFWLYG